MSKNPYVLVGSAAAVALAIYFTFANVAVDHVIAKDPDGASVVSMGPGWLGLVYHLAGAEPSLADPSRHRYAINVIEYRSPSGKTLARYAPIFTPHDYAYAAWTEKFVLISSGMNGECPDFRAFDRKTGDAIDRSSSELEALPAEIQRGYDPCGIGRDENDAWKKEQESQKK